MLRELLKDSRVEVKRDFCSATTGNVAVEYRCRGKPSGIATTEAQWQAFILSGDYHDEIVILIKTERLRNLLKKNKERFKHVQGGDDDQSSLVLLPLPELFSKN